ncbi:ABC transporter substrate-binding protein [Bradyrhizobium sp. LHD-71]|uniref:ABC transporter substrate-binding protein n=1 Tax=Bradyrhizobium sp. LHD-71 TaxID=3072141 RepID=UPI00280F8357|nr:ABC transporter substrate-binding protein [Bradyrhizobium sp. LHD-71]MDQ8728309.1 ABC transporter substrate-binding protein [Bradyrhizobium sp. LHD-71]
MGRLPRLLVASLPFALLNFLVFAIDAGRAPALAQNVKLDVALSNGWWGHVPIMLAIEKGYFKELGIDLEVKAIASSADRIRALTAGSVAFSNLGRIAVISEMANDNKSFYFFANVDDSPGNEGCWARQGFASFKDLKGKKVAANTSAQITLNGLLENEGMTEKDVQFVNLPGGEMAGAIARGDVDAACVWEPLFTNVKNAAPGGKLLGTDMDTPNYKKFGTMASPDIMIISRKLVDESPDQARKIATAIFKGVEYTNENPEDTAKAVAHYFRQDPQVVLAAMKQFKYFGAENWPEHMRLHTGQMEYLSKWLADNGKIARAPDVKVWENVSFIPK